MPKETFDSDNLAEEQKMVADMSQNLSGQDKTEIIEKCINALIVDLVFISS